MAPILLVETRADGDEEEAELEDLSGKVKSNLNYYHILGWNITVMESAVQYWTVVEIY